MTEKKKCSIRLKSDRSDPARDLWIEIANAQIYNSVLTSGPARDLWIEIGMDSERGCM